MKGNVIFSPNNIDVLLHFHVSDEPHPRREAPAVQDAIAWFLDIGVIAHGEHPYCYRTTDLGKAWVESLCNVPIPRRAFIDEMGRIIKL